MVERSLYVIMMGMDGWKKGREERRKGKKIEVRLSLSLFHCFLVISKRKNEKIEKRGEKGYGSHFTDMDSLVLTSKLVWMEARGMCSVPYRSVAEFIDTRVPFNFPLSQWALAG